MMRNISPTWKCCPASPTADAHVVPVNIQADPSRRNWYSVGAGYATDTGPRGTLTWENRASTPCGHRFSVLIQAAQVTRYQVQSNYIIPIGDPAVEKLTLAGSGRAAATCRRHHTQRVPAAQHHQGGRQLAVRLVRSGHAHDRRSAAETRTDQLLIPGIDIASVPKGYLGEPIFQHGLFVEIKGSDGVIGSDARFAAAAHPGSCVSSTSTRMAPAAAG